MRMKTYEELDLSKKGSLVLHNDADPTLDSLMSLGQVIHNDKYYVYTWDVWTKTEQTQGHHVRVECDTFEEAFSALLDIMCQHGEQREKTMQQALRFWEKE